MRQLAFPTLLLATLLLSSIFLQTTLAGPPAMTTSTTQPTQPTQPAPPKSSSPTKPSPPTSPYPTTSFCDSKCAARCSDAGMHDRCMKYCGICCQQCKCVPSGTYGNKSECPCYRDKLSSHGKPKCP